MSDKKAGPALATVFALPNLVTFVRIGAIPIFLILLAGEQYTKALFVFILAGATDSLDGALARWTDSHTQLGAYLDPLADKLLLMSSFVFLAYLGKIPPWLTIVVIGRDVVIGTGFLALFFATGRAIIVGPSLIGKASTFLQLLTVTLTLLRLHDPTWNLWEAWRVAVPATGVATALSGLQYTARAFQRVGRLDVHGLSEGKAGPSDAGHAKRPSWVSRVLG